MASLYVLSHMHSFLDAQMHIQEREQAAMKAYKLMCLLHAEGVIRCVSN
jgi:ABC-type uncharacterized transport system substrate-binding protein